MTRLAQHERLSGAGQHGEQPGGADEQGDVGGHVFQDGRESAFREVKDHVYRLVAGGV
ncbi:hypothetical protein [Catellatospora coxensis]|uniref:hypothetical protein n=1 Tax=Catellatospora coxensis TaxID=310354 RepID=UPI00194565E5|nr:hypothetical protein [Catellatospora coxensis]